MFSTCRHAVQGNSGGRYVFRYNIVHATGCCEHAIDAHGYGNNDGVRATRSWEIYENTIDTFNPQLFAIVMRGGDGVIFNNTIVDIPTVSAWLYFTQPCCLPKFCGSYPENDQIREAYIWGNVVNGVPYDDVWEHHECPDYLFREGRDYFEYERPGYTSYIYPHPLRFNSFPLSASVSASPISGDAPLSVSFTGSATGGSSPYSYDWDFEDGETSNAQNPNHTYSSGGNYTAILTVTDSNNNQASDSIDIDVSSTSHTVSNPNTPSGSSSGVPNVSYSFSTRGSICSQGHSVEYRFDWGDGVLSQWSSSTSASHSWSSTGTYTIRARSRCSSNINIVSSWSNGITIQISNSSGVILSLSSTTGSPAPGVGGQQILHRVTILTQQEAQFRLTPSQI